MMPGCGESRLSAWISRRLLTCDDEVRGRVRRGRSSSLGAAAGAGLGQMGHGRQHLLKAVKVVLHALDGNILAILDALRLEDL